MKKFAHILMFALLALIASCEDKPAENIEEATLNIPYSSHSVDGTKGSFVLAVESNTEWTITSSAEWLTPNRNEFSGSASVLISYAANTTTSSRSAKLSVAPKLEGNTPSHTILVTQKTGANSGGNTGDGGNTGGGDDGGNTGGGTVTDSGAKYAGWAELPAEDKSNSDYYYAYHMRPDKSSQRNLAICYSASKACPVWVAAVLHDCYTGGAGRSGYSPDPQIPTSVQAVPGAGDTNKGNWMNRGHMLASNKRTVSSATNQQVFYYTNIAPQNGHTLNTGGGLWNNLEDYEYEIMCADTLYSVHGCHWANTNERFNDQVVPTHFYKVYLRTKRGNTGKWVVNCSESELQCVAFYMPHNVEKCQPSSKHMISVAELEEITGVSFFPNVPNAPKETFKASDWGL